MHLAEPPARASEPARSAQRLQSLVQAAKIYLQLFFIHKFTFHAHRICGGVRQKLSEVGKVLTTVSIGDKSAATRPSETDLPKALREPTYPHRLLRKTSRGAYAPKQNRMEYDLTFHDYAARLREFTQRTAKLSYDAPLIDRTDVEFNGLAQRLFALQFAQNAPYRRFCQARRVVPQRVSTWIQVPPVPTSAFKELEMSSLSPRERTTVFYSSGTTQDRPSRHFHSAGSLARYEASLTRLFRRHVVAGVEKAEQALRLSHPNPSGEIDGARGTRTLLCVLTPPPAQAPHSSLVHMFETVRR